MSNRTGNILFALCLAFVLSPLFLGEHKKGETLGELFSKPGFLIFVVMFVVALSFLGWRVLKRVDKEERWKSPYFDDEQAYSEAAVIEVYVRLLGAMLRKDQDDLKGKLVYINRYFTKKFDTVYDEYASLLRISTAHPIKLQTITPWILKNLPDATHRSQLVYFLAGLSTVDGTMNPKEKAFLVELANLIGLTQAEFASIMAMFEKYEDAYEDQFKQRSAPTRSTSSYRLEKAYEIIGISAQATDEELKKAYRTLAKLHHPDRFSTDGAGQQALAKERFVKMQQAYELIIESRNRQ